MLKAAFFDLDDTLVATSVHDVRAFAAVTALAAERSAGVDQAKLLADFKDEFRRVPWDPEYKVEVTEWRAGLWAGALEKQGVADAASLGKELQAGSEAGPGRRPVSSDRTAPCDEMCCFAGPLSDHHREFFSKQSGICIDPRV